jgi:polar amino acid transport system substrate-binding protein
MFGGILSRLFAIKCSLTVTPFKLIISFTLSLILILGYMIRIIEFNIIVDSEMNEKYSSHDYLYLGNAMWYFFITMATGIILLILVGYGDYVPLTNLGRFIGIIAAIVGTTIISLLVISLQNNLTPSKLESQVFYN